MGIPANPYPGWWASPDRDENGDPIRRTYTQEPPEELPEWYQEDQWNYQYFEKEENWYDDSSNFHDNPFEENPFEEGPSIAKDTASLNVLGLKRSSSQEDIKKAFREKALKTHPDKGGDPADFRKVREAYECLVQ